MSVNLPRLSAACLALLALYAVYQLVTPVVRADMASTSRPDNHGNVGVLNAKQGQVLYVTLSLPGNPLSVVGHFHNRRIPFFGTGEEGQFAALLGIDMADEPNTLGLKAEVSYADSMRQRVIAVSVAPEVFREQRMTLPKDKVEPDAASLERIAMEREKVQAVFAAFTPKRLWSEPFLVPVEGTITGAFGSKRILNGQSRNQHNGEDIAAALGTPVKATNDGIVKMVDDHFFSGKGVILDHDLGLYTMYFHLDTTAVKEGDHVERGQVIGTVGKSGRATGPHLHWGAWLNGSRVNPFSLTTLPLEKARH